MDRLFRTGRLPCICSPYPSGFRGTEGPILYFALHQEVAERYRRWAKNVWGCQRTALMYAVIANSLVESCDPCILRTDGSVSGAWNADDWKRILSAARNGDAYLADLRHLQQKKLFIGHICKKDNKHFRGLESWQELTQPKHVWNLAPEGHPPNYATQYVFNDPDIIDALVEQAKFGFNGEELKSLPPAVW